MSRTSAAVARPSVTRRTTAKPAERAPAKPTLLAGGNPQIAKGEGDAPVQAYIAAMPGWKSALGRRLDALITRVLPRVRKAVKWNSPFYGVEGQGWFLAVHCYTRYVKLAFFRGTSLRPVPPGESKHEEVRYFDIREDHQLDEAQLAQWIRQAAALPGWDPARERHALKADGRRAESQPGPAESPPEGAPSRRAPARPRKEGAMLRNDNAEPEDSASRTIDEHIRELNDWRGAVLGQVRRLIHEADPDVVEEWKWKKASSPGTPVWSHGGGICTGETYKQVVKLTFFNGASLEDPARLFNSSLEGNTRRAIDIREGDTIDEAAFKDLIRAAVAFNAAKRQINKSPGRQIAK